MSNQDLVRFNMTIQYYEAQGNWGIAQAFKNLLKELL